MNKKNFFEGSIYSAPEMEVISIVAEQGFSLSDITDVEEDNMGEGL